MKNLLMLAVSLQLTLLASGQDFDKNGIDTTIGTPQGRAVGDTIDSFSVQLADGSWVSTDSLLEKGPILLVFYRGSWCPYCTRHLAEIEESAEAFSNKGITLLAVGPEGHEGLSQTIEKSKAGFLVASDPDEKAMQEMDVLFNVTEAYQEKIRKMLHTDIAENNGKEQAKLPVPATYLVDRDRVVRYVHFDRNYRTRSQVEELLELAEQLN